MIKKTKKIPKKQIKTIKKNNTKIESEMPKEEEKIEVKKGRKTIYTQKLGDKICQTISASNYGLKKVCKIHDVKYKTVLDWLFDPNHPFTGMYAVAKEQQADYLADEILEIADDCNPSKACVDKARLQVDSRKWIASKLKVKKYGDRIYQDHGGSTGVTVVQKNNYNLDALTTSELEQYKNIIKKIESAKS